MFQCSICERRLITANPNTWYCSKCFREFEEAILSKAEWTMFLQHEERKRRYREQDMKKLGITYVYIGDRFDVGDDGKLVPTKNYFEEYE